jgi:purine-binding chemotaxis protein CheW
LNPENPSPPQSSGKRIQCLAFRLSSEDYGVDIMKVREIRSMETVTRIVGAPPCVLGVINLRGMIVPVIDLRKRFELDTTAPTPALIILDVLDRSIGIVVDAVSDVLDIEPSQLRSTPEMVSIIDSEHLSGIGLVNDRMIILLDIEKLLSDQSLKILGIESDESTQS